MIDVSQFNGQIRWGSVPQTVALVRVSFGATGVDTLGSVNLAGARGAGHPTGGYHFLEDSAAQVEMENFFDHFHPRPGGVRGMIDVEPSAYSHPTTERVVAAVAEYVKLTGHNPIIYIRHDTAAALNLPAAIGECPLMYANWGPNDGEYHAPTEPIPAPWTRAAAQQYTSVGAVAGIPSHVDLSRVFDLDALLVPRPRPVIDKWRIGYVDRHGHRTAGFSRFPTLWQRRHPRVKYRGEITITPHRR